MTSSGSNSGSGSGGSASGSNNGGSSSQTEFFVEREEALACLQRVLAVDQPHDDADSSLRQLCTILSRYQENPSLLDPHLSQLLVPIIHTLRAFAVHRHQLQVTIASSTAVTAATTADDSDKDAVLSIADQTRLFSLIAHIANVRGPKAIQRFFTHDAADLEPIVAYLQASVASSQKLPPNESLPPVSTSWETRSTLMMWLALVGMAPFDLSTIAGPTDSAYSSVAEQIVGLAYPLLVASGRVMETASQLLARILTRRDSINNGLAASTLGKMTGRLSEIIAPGSSDASNSVSTSLELNGLLRAFCHVLKIAQSSKHAADAAVASIDSVIMPLAEAVAKSTVFTKSAAARKLAVKLIQRHVLCQLKPTVPKWRYSRGIRSLASNLSGNQPSATTNSKSHNSDDNEENDDIGDNNDEMFDVNDNVVEVLEVAVDLLLNSLCDKDTVVRWSAAKGIGRLTFRLPKSMALDITHSVVDLFAVDTFMETDSLNTDSVSEHTWHGATLAVAELAHRGLLIDDVLESAKQWILLALRFDLRSGSHSVGSNVRDAACYAVWSLARAYSPAVVASMSHSLATVLASVALFDREIQCRRAASAAFQEHVGRNKAFPHGIEVLTCIDYYAVGNRRRSFLQAAPKVAEFTDSYTQQLVWHLTRIVAVHWDEEMRKTGAESLAKVAVHDVDTAVINHMEHLTSAATGSSLLSHRHGSICALAALLEAKASSPVPEASSAICGLIVNALNVPLVTKPEHLREHGSAAVIEALCDLIATACRFNWPNLLNSNTGNWLSECWTRIVKPAIARLEERIDSAIARVVREMINYDIENSDGKFALNIITQLIDLLSHNNGSSASISERRSAAVALGNIDYQHTILFNISTQVLATVLDSFEHYTLQKHQSATQQQQQQPSRMQMRHTSDATIPELRRDLITALGDILSRLVASPSRSFDTQRVLHAFCAALEDYSSDNRGDVGSWTRLAAISVIPSALPVLIQHIDTLDKKREAVVSVVSRLLGQTADVLDRTRYAATTAIVSLIQIDSVQPLVVQADLLDAFSLPSADSSDDLEPSATAIIDTDRGDTADDDEDGVQSTIIAGQTSHHQTRIKLTQTDVFTRLMPLLSVSEYQCAILQGLIASIGGKTATTSTASRQALDNHLFSAASNDDIDASTLTGQIIGTLDHLQPDNSVYNRLIGAWMSTIEHLFDSGHLLDLSSDTANTSGFKLLAAIKRSVAGNRIRDIQRVLHALKLISNLAGLYEEEVDEADEPHPVFMASIRQLVLWLAHPYPRIRRSAAESLYLAFGVSSSAAATSLLEKSNSQDGADFVTIVLETDWDASPAAKRAERLQLFKLLGMAPPATPAVTSNTI
ncbi:ARM repeat-containing protein [Ramicandelaber brevisporus]|nr:ARM repeat-containing protein [Ramicandelaber brevisporus]